MSVVAAAREIGAEEVLHYTTRKGILGTIAKRALLSRERLDQDSYLEHIFQGVWPRKDPAWLDYINLSISSINADLYERSRRHHDPEMWWCVISLSVELLDHDGVWFTTTNNIFPKVRRAQGKGGFAAMFADPVIGRYEAVLTRDGVPPNQPTDRAAEVLYPGELPTRFIRSIYVLAEEHRSLIRAWCETLDHDVIDVQIRPDVFD